MFENVTYPSSCYYSFGSKPSTTTTTKKMFDICKHLIVHIPSFKVLIYCLELNLNAPIRICNMFELCLDFRL